VNSIITLGHITTILIPRNLKHCTQVMIFLAGNFHTTIFPRPGSTNSPNQCLSIGLQIGVW
jgi:hypothetical protein